MKTSPDRRTEFGQRRSHDAENYVLGHVEEILDEALEKIAAIPLAPGAELPSTTHIRLADAAIKRWIRKLNQTRYP